MLYSFAVAAVLSAALARAVALSGSSPLDHAGLEVLARQQQQPQPSCLRANLIQSASGLTGQEAGTKGIKPGQAKAATDKNNFINFCEGKTITNGQQITGGSCNGIPMGRLPAQTNMVSSVITSPQPGARLQAGATFNVTIQTAHLRAGVFVNPATNYYTSPQDLDGAGDVIGHCHVTIQDIGSLTAATPPDAAKFAFFKGVDDAGNGKGLLTARVDGGLPPGAYRVCTMISAATHQPVAMPVAQRGAQDDCTKFEVAAGALSAAGAAEGAGIAGNSKSSSKGGGNGGGNGRAGAARADGKKKTRK